MHKKPTKKTSRHLKHSSHKTSSIFLSQRFIIFFGSLVCLLGIIFFATKYYISPSSALTYTCKKLQGYCIPKQFCNDGSGNGRCVFTTDCKTIAGVPTRCWTDQPLPTQPLPTATPTPKPYNPYTCAYRYGTCEKKYGSYPPYHYLGCPSGNQEQLTEYDCPPVSLNTVIGKCCVPIKSLIKIAGRTFYDTNQKNGWNPGESAVSVPKVTIELISDKGKTIQPTTTGAGGWYFFSNLNPDYYEIEAIAPNGYHITFPVSGYYLYSEKASVTNLNFGIHKN